MKKFCSALLFAGFVLLSGWEILPKFYQTATSEVAKPLFVASTKLHDRQKGASPTAEKDQEVDYRQLTKDMNTDGA